MADQPTNRERVKEIVLGIEQNIQELFQSERYFDYLRTMSRFHSYSVNNTILIHMQRPHAAKGRLRKCGWTRTPWPRCWVRTGTSS